MSGSMSMNGNAPVVTRSVVSKQLKLLRRKSLTKRRLSLNGMKGLLPKYSSSSSNSGNSDSSSTSVKKGSHHQYSRSYHFNSNTSNSRTSQGKKEKEHVNLSSTTPILPASSSASSYLSSPPSYSSSSSSSSSLDTPVYRRVKYSESQSQSPFYGLSSSSSSSVTASSSNPALSSSLSSLSISRQSQKHSRSHASYTHTHGHTHNTLERKTSYGRSSKHTFYNTDLSNNNSKSIDNHSSNRYTLGANKMRSARLLYRSTTGDVDGGNGNHAGTDGGNKNGDDATDDEHGYSLTFERDDESSNRGIVAPSGGGGEYRGDSTYDTADYGSEEEGGAGPRDKAYSPHTGSSRARVRANENENDSDNDNDNDSNEDNDSVDNVSVDSFGSSRIYRRKKLLSGEDTTLYGSKPATRLTKARNMRTSDGSKTRSKSKARSRSCGGGGKSSEGFRESMTNDRYTDESSRDDLAKSRSPSDRDGSRGSSSNGDTLTRALVGLGNLGNTCFMNSALQCLITCPSLLRYFGGKRKAYTSDINRRSPTKGKLAAAFGELMKSMVRRQGGGGCSGAVERPTAIKRLISTIAPQFTGTRTYVRLPV